MTASEGEDKLENKWKKGYPEQIRKPPLGSIAG